MPRRVTAALSKRLPRFAVSADEVNSLGSPGAFYRGILDGIHKARERIVISTLYIGSDRQAKALLDAIKTALRQSPGLHVTVLVDGNRNLRGPAQAASHEGNGNQRHRGNFEALQSLVKEFGGDRVGCYLFPNPPSTWLAWFLTSVIGGRIREMFTVFHAKVYIFDDEVILSGANLSEVYFTTRQDRYVSITNASVSNFYKAVVLKLCNFSARVASEGAAPCQSPQLSSHDLGRLRTEFHALFETERGESRTDSHSDTYIFPAVEYGWAGLQLDTEASSLLVSSYANDCRAVSLIMSAGYLNPTPEFWELLRRWGSAASIICPSLSANGWHNATGITKHIPFLFRARLESLNAKGLGGCVKVLEWARAGQQRRPPQGFQQPNDAGNHGFEGQGEDIKMINKTCDYTGSEDENWSYHAKGIWIGETPPGEVWEGFRPFATSFGSSNYNYRSRYRDFEVQAYLITENQRLKSILGLEVRQLLNHVASNSDVLTMQKERVTNLFYRTWAHIAKTIL